MLLFDEFFDVSKQILKKNPKKTRQTVTGISQKLMLMVQNSREFW